MKKIDISEITFAFSVTPCQKSEWQAPRNNILFYMISSKLKDQVLECYRTFVFKKVPHLAKIELK